MIRTSNYLTATQQNELTEKIEAVLTAEDTASVELTSDITVAETEDSSEIESDELVLYDEDGYKITCLGYEENNRMYGSNVLTLKIQNLNHFDVDIMDNGSYVNGSMMNIGAYFSISSGKEQTVEAIIDPTNLKDANIDKVTTITLNLTVRDSDSNNLKTIGPLDIAISESGDVIKNVIYRDSETIKEVQTILNELGYDCRDIDGSAGKIPTARFCSLKRIMDLQKLPRLQMNFLKR